MIFIKNELYRWFLHLTYPTRGSVYNITLSTIQDKYWDKSVIMKNVAGPMSPSINIVSFPELIKIIEILSLEKCDCV